MLGRVLLAFVCLIIAAGLVLPLYPHPRDVMTAAVAASGPVQLVAASDALCAYCPVNERGSETRCGAECPCDQVLPAVFVPLDQGVSVTLSVAVRPQTSQPAKLPAKLPAI